MITTESRVGAAIATPARDRGRPGDSPAGPDLASGVAARGRAMEFIVVTVSSLAGRGGLLASESLRHSDRLRH
jgi:hypothetical protein